MPALFVKPWWYWYTPRRLMQRWFPKHYVRWRLAKIKIQHQEQINAARKVGHPDIAQFAYNLSEDRREYEDWLAEIESRELVREAKKRDVYLDDIPLPELDEGDRSPGSHWVFGAGSEYLHYDSRKELLRRMREREPAYRKERRERMQLTATVVAAFAGLVSAATALVLALKK